jgi:hypothetical protein
LQCSPWIALFYEYKPTLIELRYFTSPFFPHPYSAFYLEHAAPLVVAIPCFFFFIDLVTAGCDFFTDLIFFDLNLVSRLFFGWGTPIGGFPIRLL